MAPVLKVALSHSGVCRNIPRAIVYAPLQFQGLAVPDLYVEQGFSKLIRLIKFGRKSTAITTNLLRHSGEAMKLELGLNGFLLQQDFTKYSSIISPSWMKESWRFLAQQDICVADDLPGFGSLRQHDHLLMEGFTELGLSDAELGKLNVCRIHLQVLTIADITEGSGECITWNAWNGKRALPHTSRYTWGHQPTPPATFWSGWKHALATLCGRDRRLTQPLGHWTVDGCSHWIWWYDECTEALFRRTEGASYCYPEKSARNTRQAVWRFIERTQIASDIPLSATPCTVVRQGQFLLFQGTAPCENRPVSIPPSFSSFGSYLASVPSNSWVFAGIQIHGSLEDIAQSIQTGTCSCVTDSSYKDLHGTAAWKILDLDQPENAIEGQVVTPGFPYQQDAYRSELSGLYASVTVINAMVEYFQIGEGSITLACDNILAGRMSLYDALGTNPASCSQYDLVMAIQYIKTPLVTWIHKHVKGHQDDNPDLVLSPLELVNVEMDLKAKHHWHSPRQWPRTIGSTPLMASPGRYLWGAQGSL
jgi:hypothetical protein